MEAKRPFLWNSCTVMLKICTTDSVLQDVYGFVLLLMVMVHSGTCLGPQKMKELMMKKEEIVGNLLEPENISSSGLLVFINYSMQHFREHKLIYQIPK